MTGNDSHSIIEMLGALLAGFVALFAVFKKIQVDDAESDLKIASANSQQSMIDALNCQVCNLFDRNQHLSNALDEAEQKNIDLLNRLSEQGRKLNEMHLENERLNREITLLLSKIRELRLRKNDCDALWDGKERRQEGDT